MSRQTTASEKNFRPAALVAGVRGALWLTEDGEVEELSHGAAAQRLGKGLPVLVCHSVAVARRLNIKKFPALDLLELFAFVRPARFCLPTARGLAQALGLPIPGTPEKEAASLFAAAEALLDELSDLTDKARGEALPIAFAMTPVWPWGPMVLEALGGAALPPSRTAMTGLAVWNRLEEWSETGPPPPPGNEPVKPEEARKRLKQLLGSDAEERPQQADYAGAVTHAFAPRDREGEPCLVLAEAGTGVGKTLGYIAPAGVWAETNKGCVWISTFTRNLQRQLDGELDRLYPDAAEKARNVVIRKGRENYFCLLNFEEAVNRFAGGGNLMLNGNETTALGLVARWVSAGRDGDMAGGDFPAWLAGLLGRELTLDLTDTRGECVYSACSHYRRCFVERSIRRARNARIVVANHALVMIQAALGAGGEDSLPVRYVFDEGHHIFGAADGAFSLHLTGNEAAELRRWILGAEDGMRSRSRGLKARIGDLVEGDEAASSALAEALRAARALPAPDWRRRLAGGEPRGPAETFLFLVRQQVYARHSETKSAYSLETATASPVPGMTEAAQALEEALIRMSGPLNVLGKALGGILDTKAAELDTASRLRVEAVRRGLERRALVYVEAWRAMLGAIGKAAPPEFVDWFGVERIAGRDVDIGLHRHWLDPTIPFAETVAKPAQGLLVTSATLRDGTGDEDIDWACALARTGAAHLASPPVLSVVPSPFDYKEQTRVLVVGDVLRTDPAAVSAAYRELFLAAGGGALGLFTAINRLKEVYKRIAPALEAAGLELLSQHVDAMDTGALIDIFRAEADSCLLGTDAVRDGVDVPGRSLRLIVFDRVPWPRPDILHKARREAFGNGRRFDEMLTRLKLKQAYGRLLRRGDDRGVFVMLDGGLPSRMAGAFPEGVEIRRLGLAEAIEETRSFLDNSLH
ncbi:MAG: helicase [Rhodospirillales bacterium RIFCSPLOWO2_12_FULL_58_28]|nr:MAG: helicase [Rhodospirillales bacterium RIFCSPLOWO2_02_FULL_58_16]OHC79833.1 MAG: helicase [Rhodospirillales bacterium RIFCSPLOWO2_12_FULL_58_28]